MYPFFHKATMANVPGEHSIDTINNSIMFFSGGEDDGPWWC
jgi:hypothetical protein